MKHYIFVIIIFLFVGCTGRTPVATETKEISNVIDLNSGLKNIQAIRLSEIADSITFIPFETPPKSIQGQGQKNIIFSDRYIFFYDKYYDWTGKYLGSIGRRGNGPFEEPEGVNKLLFADNHFYSKGSKFIEYDITGKPTGKKRNLYDKDYIGFLTMGTDFFSTGNHFAVFDYPSTIYFFDKNFEIVSSRIITEVDSVKTFYNPIGSSNYVTYYKENILFYNFMNDTIFYISDTDLKSKWVVSFDGTLRLPTEAILNARELIGEMTTVLRSGTRALGNAELVKLTDNKHKVESVYETESYLFFRMAEISFFAELRGKQSPNPYIVYYDKRTGKTVRTKEKGFVDDLLGMDFFFPQLGVFDEKMITYIWPHELLDYIDECRERGRDVNPQLMALSKKIALDDNPILILAHLKK